MSGLWRWRYVRGEEGGGSTWSGVDILGIGVRFVRVSLSFDRCPALQEVCQCRENQKLGNGDESGSFPPWLSAFAER